MSADELNIACRLLEEGLALNIDEVWRRRVEDFLANLSEPVSDSPSSDTGANQ
jgi:hypothetical protein